MPRPDEAQAKSQARRGDTDLAKLISLLRATYHFQWQVQYPQVGDRCL